MLLKSSTIALTSVMLFFSTTSCFWQGPKEDLSRFQYFEKSFVFFFLKKKKNQAIRAIPVRKALYQFGDDLLQILFDYNQLARLRFPQTFRQMWYKSLRQLQVKGEIFYFSLFFKCLFSFLLL